MIFYCLYFLDFFFGFVIGLVLFNFIRGKEEDGNYQKILRFINLVMLILTSVLIIWMSVSVSYSILAGILLVLFGFFLCLALIYIINHYDLHSKFVKFHSFFLNIRTIIITIIIFYIFIGMLSIMSVYLISNAEIDPAMLLNIIDYSIIFFHSYFLLAYFINYIQEETGKNTSR